MQTWLTYFLLAVLLHEEIEFGVLSVDAYPIYPQCITYSKSIGHGGPNTCHSPLLGTNQN